jgi:hypothetical protein
MLKIKQQKNARTIRQEILRYSLSGNHKHD